MEIIDALVLGLVQGLTEFIPVSSSGHLVILDAFTPIRSEFDFDVLINIGTLVALILYFRLTIGEIITHITRERDYKLLRNIILSTIPAVIVGGLWSVYLENIRVGEVTIAMLLFVGLIMVILPKIKLPEQYSKTSDLPYIRAIWIGCAQAVALIPGTSRSGATIIAGRLAGFSYKRAAEYSFIIAIPVLFGAIMRTLLTMEGQTFVLNNLTPLILGNIVAFASSYFAINFMIGYLQNKGLAIFGWYRIALALMLILVIIVK